MLKLMEGRVSAIHILVWNSVQCSVWTASLMKKELREGRGGFESLGSVWDAAKPEGRVRTL